MQKPQGIGSKYLEIIIQEDGNVALEAHGYTGLTCRQATAQLEIGLWTVQSRKDKKGPDAKQTVRSK